MTIVVPAAGAEEARAALLELFPEGFEERDIPAGIELVAYADPERRQRLEQAFADVRAEQVEEGWEQRWREFHHGTWAGPVWLGPPWERPPDGAVAVVIEPGRAFGTGAHPTTRLCVELLAALPRSSLLDIGCGSGVLAVAAAKLAYSPVHAVDVDADAVAVTRQNAEANGVAVEVMQGDCRSAPLPATETAVANVTLEVVEGVAARLSCARLVTAGYLAADSPHAPGFRHVERALLDGWAADVWERG